MSAVVRFNFCTGKAVRQSVNIRADRCRATQQERDHALHDAVRVVAAGGTATAAIKAGWDYLRAACGPVREHQPRPAA